VNNFEVTAQSQTINLSITIPMLYWLHHLTCITSITSQLFAKNNELLTNVRTWWRLCATKSSKTVSRRPNGSRIPDRVSWTVVIVPTLHVQTVTRLFCRHLLA